MALNGLKFGLVCMVASFAESTYWVLMTFDTVLRVKGALKMSGIFTKLLNYIFIMYNSNLKMYDYIDAFIYN